MHNVAENRARDRLVYAAHLLHARRSQADLVACDACLSEGEPASVELRLHCVGFGQVHNPSLARKRLELLTTRVLP